MNRRQKLAICLLCGGLLILAACGGGGESVEPAAVATEDPIAQSVSQTVAAIAVAQTVAAIAGEGGQTQEVAPPTAAPAATVAPSAAPPTVEPPTSAPEATLPPPTAAAPSAGTCTVVGGVNMRSGPGTAYNPPLGSLGVGTQLIPLAYLPAGFPDGQWLQVQIAATGQVGWISAGRQFVSCDTDVAALPRPARISPTPAPPPTATPFPATPTPIVVAGPPRIDNDRPGGQFPTDHVYGEVIVDPAFLFRMDVRDLNVGDFEGAGTKSAEFVITGNGRELYRRKENTAGYCIFGGGEPICNPWPVNAEGRYTWGQGGPVVEPGSYFASITVVAENPDPVFGDQWNWNFDFRVTLP